MHGSGYGWRDHSAGPTPARDTIERTTINARTVRCTHRSSIRPVRPDGEGCDECIAIGSEWVHLRMCLTCGAVRCCDSSPHQHASKHAANTHHPIVRSMEPGEDWMWCYVDEVYIQPA